MGAFDTTSSHSDVPPVRLLLLVWNQSECDQNETHITATSAGLLFPVQLRDEILPAAIRNKCI